MIYCCEHCHYLFEDMDSRDNRCPDCGKTAVRPATEKEQAEYAQDHLYTECTCSAHVRTPQGPIPVAGVVVALKTSEDGEPVLTAVTGRDGFCSFGKRLDSKTYYAEVVEPPVGFAYIGGQQQIFLHDGYTTQISFSLEEQPSSKD